MIYLDNAATSFPKPKSVIKSVNNCIKKYCGNPGRSGHKLSLLSAEKIYEARESVATLLGTSESERVIFTLNATYALNLAIKTFIKDKCHIITSDSEHNSVLRPLIKAAQATDSKISYFNTDENIESNITKLIRKDTKFLISTLKSNVTGRQISLNVLSKIKKQYNLTLIIDASQQIGHNAINLKKTPCDVLCAPAHKGLFGIQGAGFAFFQDKIPTDSFIEGGSGVDSANTKMPEYLPERFEAGTLPTPSIAALYEGINFISKIGIDEIGDRISLITDKYKSVLSEFPEVKIYSFGSGIISFSYGEIPSSVISDFLNKQGIYVRSGLHCAPMIHKKLNTDRQGLTRLSFSLFNKPSEADKFYKCMKHLASIY